MKILYKTMGLGLLSACLCLLCAAPALAKVCFVGEENCTGGGSFDEYKDPAEDGKVCTDEGYILKVRATRIRRATLPVIVRITASMSCAAATNMFTTPAFIRM